MATNERPWHIWCVSAILIAFSAPYFLNTGSLLVQTILVLGETDISFVQLFSPFFTIVLSGLTMLAAVMLFMMRKISLYLYLAAILMNISWLVFMQYFSATAGTYSVAQYMKDLIPAVLVSLYILTLIKRGFLR